MIENIEKRAISKFEMRGFPATPAVLWMIYVAIDRCRRLANSLRTLVLQGEEVCFRKC